MWLKKNVRMDWHCGRFVQMTPGGAYEIMDILGKEESLKRIRKGIELLNGVQ